MELNNCLETYFKSQNLFFFSTSLVHNMLVCEHLLLHLLMPWDSLKEGNLLNMCTSNFSGLILENGISRSTIQGTYNFSESYTTPLVLDLSWLSLG